MKYAAHLTSVLVLLFCATTSLSANKQQIVAGAGPSTVIVQLFFELLTAKMTDADVQFQVPKESTKHVGGLKNSDDYLFGRIGRPLNKNEKEGKKLELFLAKVPFVFVVGPKVGVRKLSLAQIEDIFLRRTTNWRDVGGPDAEIIVVGREPTEAFYSALKSHSSDFENCGFDYILTHDHEVTEFLETTKGEYTIAFGAKPNFSFINIIEVPNFDIGINIGLVYDTKNSKHPLVDSARKFSRTSEWLGGLLMLGLLPPDR